MSVLFSALYGKSPCYSVLSYMQSGAVEAGWANLLSSLHHAREHVRPHHAVRDLTEVNREQWQGSELSGGQWILGQ